MKVNPWLIALLALSLLLGIGYGLATPIGAAPDEAAHVRYVQILAEEHRLPVLRLEHRRAVTESGDIEFEAHQPPLYYVLAVPFYALGKVAGGAAGAAWGCRVLSLMITLAGTVLVWRLARVLVPSRTALQLAAAAFAALLPMRLAISASVNNDGLTEALSTLALILMARLLVDRPDEAREWNRRAAWIGGVVALALLTKATAIVLLPAVLATFYLASGARDERRESGAWTGLFLKGGAVSAAVVLLVAGWWFARNQVLYGDVLGRELFDRYFADTPRWTTHPDFPDRPGLRETLGISFLDYLFRIILPTSFASFWGAFGHLRDAKLFMGGYNPNELTEPAASLVKGLEVFWPILELDGKFFIPYKSWVYPLLVIACLLAAAGGVQTRWRNRKASPRARRPAPDLPLGRARWIVGLHALFVFAALLNFTATYFQGQGRYLLPAIGGIALGLTAGWLALAPRREKVGAAIIIVGMLGLALYALFGVLVPGFSGPT